MKSAGIIYYGSERCSVLLFHENLRDITVLKYSDNTQPADLGRAVRPMVSPRAFGQGSHFICAVPKKLPAQRKARAYLAYGCEV